MKYLSLFNVPLGTNADGQSGYLNISLDGGERYVLHSSDPQVFQQFYLIAEQKYPSTTIGLINRHTHFFCQYDTAWLNHSFVCKERIFQWVQAEKNPYLPSYQMFTKDLLYSLELYGDQFLYPHQLPPEKQMNFCLLSFLCHTRGIAFSEQIQNYVWQKHLQPFWDMFIEKSPLAVVFFNQAPACSNLITIELQPNS